ncbi:MAG TPA: septal ring lytic transglycosylase RlpA family protein [Rhodocyclaceae bacterium]
MRPSVERGESTAPPAAAKPAPQKPQPAWVLKRGGGYYQDDGPGDNPPADLDGIPDAVPRAEPPHRFANNPYSVLGRDYVPLKPGTPYRASGIASWYGRKFNGQKTSSGEVYDMYGMTAAHATLPIPSYARVTNPANGKSVIVRINDRGPFHAGRIIDLSYTAAWKLGYVGNGSTLVEVESIQPGQETLVAARSAPPAATEDDPIARFAAAEEPPAKPLPEVRGAGGGHYLQLGAFGNRDNAEALKARLARELGDLGDKLVVQASGRLYRLQLGPWADAQEARAVSQRIRETLDSAPVVVQR